MRAGRSPSRSLKLRFVALVASFSIASAFAAENPGGISESPLAPRSGPRGSTMFKTMLPADTGVVTENRYADPKMWWELYQEFTTGPIGTGIAVGDYDGDEIGRAQ